MTATYERYRMVNGENEFPFFLHENNTFEVNLNCTQRISLVESPYILCKVVFSSVVHSFDSKFLYVSGGDVKSSSIIHVGDRETVSLITVSVYSSSSSISCQLLYGSAIDLNDRVSKASNMVSVTLSKSTFGISLRQNNTLAEACQSGHFLFEITTATPVIGIPVNAISILGATVDYISRISSTV